MMPVPSQTCAMGPARVRRGIGYRGAKRLMDVVASAIGLLLLLPIFVGVAAAIKW